MLNIIDNDITFDKLLKYIGMENEVVIDWILLKENHPTLHNKFVMGFYFPKHDSSWLCSNDSKDIIYNLNFNILIKTLNSNNKLNKLVFNKKQLNLLLSTSLDNSYKDLNFMNYVNFREPLKLNRDYIEIDEKFKRLNFRINSFINTRFSDVLDYRIIPVYLQAEYLHYKNKLNYTIYNNLKKYTNIDATTFNYFNDKVTSVFTNLESAGITVNQKNIKSILQQANGKEIKNIKLLKDISNFSYSKNGLLFPEYNLYASPTGRASATYMSTNFMALDKKSKIRSFITSRFDNGKLVEFDYDGFHLRIAGLYVGYKIPETVRAHDYLAKIMGEESNEQTKQNNFAIMYGGPNGMINKYKSFPFFKSIFKYMKSLDNKEQITLLTGRKLNLKGISNSKLFNYIIQATEFDFVVEAISKVQGNKDAIPILYGYDSILFDTKIDDYSEIKGKLQNIYNYRFPVQLKIGKNYQEMQHAR